MGPYYPTKIAHSLSDLSITTEKISALSESAKRLSDIQESANKIAEIQESIEQLSQVLALMNFFLILQARDSTTEYDTIVKDAINQQEKSMAITFSDLDELDNDDGGQFETYAEFVDFIIVIETPETDDSVIANYPNAFTNSIYYDKSYIFKKVGREGTTSYSDLQLDFFEMFSNNGRLETWASKDDLIELAQGISEVDDFEH